ncbi:hypothetical protein SEVIR_7G026300v4 [Setaria viridis]|uniref:F-box domain-containing protein n=1 Tax=Setaria viridis TaxID=4556 RepID=A0A4U6TLI6_SETVI|nr:putative F-box/FBD/LRR-repeat protein At1g78760 isoform X1 [Setaria viridis]TKW03468.1 hypothetical protein SEVIR_7G026300v2 [Setaria viridis]
MAGQARPSTMHQDVLRVADSGGMDPQELEALFDRVLSSIHDALPAPPVSADGDLCILFDAEGGGVDRLSFLPDKLLCDIVSRLPIKDAARAAVLSRRWRPIWRAAPLVLVDTHLLPAGDDEIPVHLDRAHSNTVAATVSCIFAAHPGPFRCVRLTCCYMEEDRAQLERWLKIFAVKGIEQLFLINRPWPLAINKHLPATFFSMATLTRLYLGFWRFPDTSALPRGAAFPCLRELALCGIVMDSRDMDFVLARSPVLEILSVDGHMLPPLRLRIVSHSLRCMQIHSSSVESVTVVDARRLERLFLGKRTNESSSFKIKIGHAPALRMFGSIELENEELQVGNTTVKAGTVVNPSVMVPSVTTLDVNVRFGVRNDTKMLPSILRCFPNIEVLHIHSKKTTESTGRLGIKFWQESCAIKCVLSSINMLSFYDFRGERNELAFLKFFVESAQMLKMLVVVYANGYCSSRDEANSKVKALFAGKRANDSCKVVVCESRFSEGGRCWELQRGCDFSFDDPFGLIGCSSFGVYQWSV